MRLNLLARSLQNVAKTVFFFNQYFEWETEIYPANISLLMGPEIVFILLWQPPVATSDHSVGILRTPGFQCDRIPISTSMSA